MSKDVLVIVDVQKDFLPGGALGVPGGDEIIPSIIEFGWHRFEDDNIAFTRDYHPANHISFSDEPLFIDKSWPSHCVENTPGVEIHPTLLKYFGSNVFSKGMNPGIEQYSGYHAVNAHQQTLENWLDEREAYDVYVVGLALDYCVKNTAIDLASNGFTPIVITAGTRPVAYQTGVLAVVEMARAGVDFE